MAAINDPVVVAEVAALHEAYEAALAGNDVEKLTGFFWDSALALRFGVAESQYGADEILAFRKARPAIDLARTVSHLKIVTFGADTAIVTIEFERSMAGAPRRGRQSQVWRKLPEGWRVVSAHVSLVPAPSLQEAAALVGLTIPEEYREGVRRNIERSRIIAQPLLDLPLGPGVETAPVFEPGTR